MTAKLFSRRRRDGQPSTQFAATIVAMPGADLPLLPGQGVDAMNPDTLSPDSIVTDASNLNAAVPDVLTDIGGLPSEVPDPADAPTLSHIGRYALKRQLGSGGLGTVFEAWDPLLSRAVAVKTLQFDVDHSARVSLDGLFLNEARAAASLNHRYIVTIHDAGLSAHGVYIAMERLYGRDLQQALAAGWQPTVEQAVQLVRRVTEALAFAHARGVVHCDIKPANIFLQRRDRPKVLDFGIARIVHGTALPALEGAVAGSPRYRSPEQQTGAPVDARSDLFSLGAVMYELLAGRRAFEGESLAEINDAVLERDPTPVHEVNPRVPQDLSAIVSRMMARAVADRYTCASELAADLRRWSHEQPSRKEAQVAKPVSASAPSGAVASSRAPRWLLAGAGLLAAAALVAAWEPWRTTAPAEPAQTTPVAAGADGASAAAPVAAAPTVVTVDAAPDRPAGPAADGAAEVAADSSTGNAVSREADTASAAPASTAVSPDRSWLLPPAVPATAAATSSNVPPVTSTLPSTGTRVKPVGPGGQPGPVAEPAVRAAKPAPVVPTGVVQLAVSPWAELEVDGADNGITPPVVRLTLSEGTHTIVLRNADYAPHTVQVQVTADKPVSIRHRFSP